MKDLNKAQDQLDDKQRELEAVQAQYDQAMAEKQVCKKAHVQCTWFMF
jgi:dynein heavy chain